MKVNPEDLNRLLDVQDYDTAVDTLKRKASTLPIHARITELTQQHGTMSDELIAAHTALGDAQDAASRAEADVVPVRERLVRNQARVDAGAMDPKALSNAIDEIEHLKQRISDLEDAQLEAMGDLDMAEAHVAQLTQTEHQVAGELRDSVNARDAEVAQLARQAKNLHDSREGVAAQIAPDLLGLYEKIRARSGGVGVAHFQGGRCLGCGLEATVTDANRYASTPSDELIRCAECDRILVR